MQTSSSEIVGTDIEDEIMARAFKAWRRSGGNDEPSNASSVVHHTDGEHYAVLMNRYGVLAAYRVGADNSIRRVNDVPTGLGD